MGWGWEVGTRADVGWGWEVGKRADVVWGWELNGLNITLVGEESPFAMQGGGQLGTHTLFVMQPLRLATTRPTSSQPCPRHTTHFSVPASFFCLRVSVITSSAVSRLLNIHAVSANRSRHAGRTSCSKLEMKTMSLRQRQGFFIVRLGYSPCGGGAIQIHPIESPTPRHRIASNGMTKKAVALLGTAAHDIAAQHIPSLYTTPP